MAQLNVKTATGLWGRYTCGTFSSRESIFIEPSSVRPVELTDTYANWTLTHLAIGDVSAITLKLDVTKHYPDELVNRVKVNNSTNVTRAATVTNSLPEGMVLLGTTVPFASYENDIVFWNLAEIGPFETVTIAYSVKAIRC